MSENLTKFESKMAWAFLVLAGIWLWYKYFGATTEVEKATGGIMALLTLLLGLCLINFSVMNRVLKRISQKV